MSGKKGKFLRICIATVLLAAASVFVACDDELDDLWTLDEFDSEYADEEYYDSEHAGADTPETEYADADAPRVECSITDSPLIHLPDSYDEGKIERILDALQKAVDGGDSERVTELYNEALEEIMYIGDLSTLWYTKLNENIYDERAAENNSRYEALYDEASDRLFIIVEGTETGDDIYEAFDVPGTEDSDSGETADLSDRERQLVNRCITLSEMDAFTFTYDGAEHSLGDVYSASGEYGEMTGEAYAELFEAGMKEYNAVLGKIFLELADIRTKLAKQNGYASYPEYQDAETYKRDYTTEEISAFRKAVKDYFAYGTPNTGDFSALTHEHDTTAEEAVGYVRNYLSAIDPCIKEAADHFAENRLYSLGSEACRADGVGYTTGLASIQEAFILMEFSKSTTDIDGITHEFGHYTRSYYFKPGTGQDDDDCADVCEIHSQGLQALSMPAYAKAYPEDAEDFREYFICNMLDCIAMGCIVDEFEREVYSHPEWTLDRVNRCYADICDSYGKVITDTTPYEWVSTTHLYTNPVYYISYATSAFAALQIYDLSKTDYESAVGVWKGVLFADTGKSFMQVCSESGLKSIADAKTVLRTLEEAA